MKIELVAKTIVLSAEGRMLVLRRHDNDEHRAGMWDLPGGQVDPGEHPLESAVREAFEETGLAISHLRTVHVGSRIHGECQVIKTVFLTHTYSGTITLSHEHNAYHWITMDEFVNLTVSNDYKTAVRMIQHTYTLSS